jgi:Phenol hydroxylase, C-terminal dimerisation domain
MVRFMTLLTIVSTPTERWEIDDLPLALRIARDQIYVDDLFDRRAAEAGTHAPLHAKYGIDPERGAIVAVRPDGEASLPSLSGPQRLI